MRLARTMISSMDNTVIGYVTCVLLSTIQNLHYTCKGFLSIPIESKLPTAFMTQYFLVYKNTRAFITLPSGCGWNYANKMLIHNSDCNITLVDKQKSCMQYW